MIFHIFDAETVEDHDFMVKTTRKAIGLDSHFIPEWEPREVTIARGLKNYCKPSKDAEELSENPEACFMNPRFQRPIVVASVFMNETGQILGHEILDAKTSTDAELARTFWGHSEALWRPVVAQEGRSWNRHFKWVTFNGKGFDAQVMELAALRHGVSTPHWFTGFEAAIYENPRHAWSCCHLDLYRFLSPYQKGGDLSFWSRAAGMPGKLMDNGADVAKLWAAGEVNLIKEYCLTDCLNAAGLLVATLNLHKDILTESHLNLSVRSPIFRTSLAAVVQQYPNSQAIRAFWEAYESTIPF